MWDLPKGKGAGAHPESRAHWRGQAERAVLSRGAGALPLGPECDPVLEERQRLPVLDTLCVCYFLQFVPLDCLLKRV